MKEYIIKVDDPSERAWDGSRKVFEIKELVRCKDCKYWVGNWLEEGNMINTKCTLSHRYPQPGDWFCADGERI